jgi:hypothetical protein
LNTAPLNAALKFTFLLTHLYNPWLICHRPHSWTDLVANNVGQGWWTGRQSIVQTDFPVTLWAIRNKFVGGIGSFLNRNRKLANADSANLKI